MRASNASGVGKNHDSRPISSSRVVNGVTAKCYTQLCQTVAHHSSFFCSKRCDNIPTRTPLTRASNASGVGKNHDSRPISGFITCCQWCDSQVLYTQLCQTVASR